jgi:outer membrane protein TolC
VVSGDEQLLRTRDALGLALGLDHAAGLAPGFNVDGLVVETGNQCHAVEKLSDRTDIAAAITQAESARQSRLQALAGYLPTLGLSSSLFGYTTEPGFGRMGSWSVSAVLSVPIWEGGFRRGQIREREGIETQAKESAEQTRRDASVQVEQARRNLRVAQALLQTAVDSRALAQRTDELTRRSFEVGKASSVELVQSAQTLRQGDVTLAVREYEWVQARLNAFLTEATCDW